MSAPSARTRRHPGADPRLREALRKSMGTRRAAQTHPSRPGEMVDYGERIIAGNFAVSNVRRHGRGEL